jgi:hypothetical protein
MTATLTIDPDAPRKALQQKEQFLAEISKAKAVLILIGDNFQLPQAITGDALDKIRAIIIAEALKSHAECLKWSNEGVKAD